MEYIVYVTINTVNNKIYVGVHLTEDSTKFDGYIGNGININKASSIKHPKEPFHYAVKKYGFKAFKRIVLCSYDNILSALDLEAEIVNEDFIKRKDTYNITIGGGLPPLLNKKVYQYDFNGNFIKEWFSLTEAGIELKTAPNCIGRAALYKRTSASSYWSFYKFDKLDISEYKKYSPEQPVHIYDEFGIYVRSFKSQTECAKFLNSNISHIQRSIKTSTMTKGYYISLELSQTFIKPKKERLSGLIHQYDLDGNYIQSFKNPTELETKLGLKTSGINTSIRLNQSYKGFLWLRGEKLDKIDPFISKTKSRKIGQYSQEGKLIKVFDTLRAARKEFPNVSKVLNGTAKHCHNFIFKYLE